MKEMTKVDFESVNEEKDGILYSSPFGYHEGEILVMEELSDGFGRYIELNDLQSGIVQAVNTLLVGNRMIIRKMLSRMGISVTDDKLSKELLLLSQNCYLTRMAFQNPDGSVSSLKVYRLGRKGKGFLRQKMNQKVRLSGYMESRNACEVKKLLSANQAMLSITENDPSAFMETAKMFLYKKKENRKTDMLFRALGIVNDGDMAYIIQPLKNSGTDNIRELLQKLGRMEKVIKKCGKKQLGLPENITVLIVAENEVWMDYYEPVLRKVHFSHFDLAVSYDRLLYLPGTLGEKLHYIEPEPFWKRLLKVG